MATSDFKITEGAGINIATHAITEDAITKEIQRVNLSDSAGVEQTAIGGYNGRGGYHGRERYDPTVFERAGETIYYSG